MAISLSTITSNLGSLDSASSKICVYTSDSTLWVVYGDSIDGKVYLKYSDDLGSSWSSAIEVGTGTRPVLCTDSSDNLHITYKDGANGLKYRKRNNGGSFDSEQIVSATVVRDNNIDIIVRSNGNIHIFWVDDTNQWLQHSIYTTSWNTNTLNSGGVVTALQHVEFDSNEYIHLIYREYAAADQIRIYYDKYTTSWVGRTQLNDDVTYSPTFPDLAIESDDIIWAFWVETGHGSYPTKRQLVYKKYTGSWSAVSVLTDYNTNIGGTCAIVDGIDNIFVSYNYVGAGPTYPAQNNSAYMKYDIINGWESEVNLTDENATVGLPCAVFVDEYPFKIHILFRNGSSSPFTLSYGNFDAEGIKNDSATLNTINLTTNIIPDVRNVSCDLNVLGLNINIIPDIRSEVVNLSPIEMYSNPVPIYGPIDRYLIADDVNDPYYSDRRAAIDSNKDIWIVYSLNSNDKVYAVKSTDQGTTWGTPIEIGEGERPVCYMDNSDNLHIAYTHSTNGIKYRRKNADNSLESEQSVGSDVSGSRYTDIIVESNGTVHVFRTKWAVGGYKLWDSQFNGSSWSDVEIDTVLVDGHYADLDSDGNIHVIYRAGGATPYYIYYKKYTGSWSGATQLNDDTNQTPGVPFIIHDSNNYLWALWTETGHGTYTNYRQVVYKKYISSWSAVTVLTDWEVDSYGPCAEFDGIGDLYVAYRRQHANLGSYWQNHIACRRYHDSNWSNEYPLTQTRNGEVGASLKFINQTPFNMFMSVRRNTDGTFALYGGVIDVRGIINVSTTLSTLGITTNIISPTITAIRNAIASLSALDLNINLISPTVTGNYKGDYYYIEKAIVDYIRDNWTATSIQYPGVNIDVTGLDSWISVYFMSLSSNKHILGCNSNESINYKYNHNIEYRCNLIIEVYTKINKGTKISNEYIDLLKDLFKYLEKACCETQFKLNFKYPQFREIGTYGTTWFRQDLVVPFIAHSGD